MADLLNLGCNCCGSTTCPNKVCTIPELCSITVNVFGEEFTVYFDLSSLTWDDLSDATYERCKTCIPTTGGELCDTQFDLVIIDTSTLACNMSLSCTFGKTIVNTVAGNVIVQHIRWVDFKDFCIEIRRDKTTNQISIKHTYNISVTDQFSSWFEGTWTSEFTSGSNNCVYTYVFTDQTCSTFVGLAPNTNGTATCPSFVGSLLADNLTNCSPPVGTCGSISSSSNFPMTFAFDSGWVEIDACANMLDELTAESSNTNQHEVTNTLGTIPSFVCSAFPTGGFGFSAWCFPGVTNRIDSYTRNCSPVTYNPTVGSTEPYPWWSPAWNYTVAYQRSPASTLSCGVSFSDTDCEPPEPLGMRIVQKNTYIPFEHPGRKHWEELHSKADPTPEWFSDWESRIPKTGCDCEEHWKELKEKLPPDFSSPQAFFEWGWACHNDVNRRLGKAELSLDEAKQLYVS